ADGEQGARGVEDAVRQLGVAIDQTAGGEDEQTVHRGEAEPGPQRTEPLKLLLTLVEARGSERCAGVAQVRILDIGLKTDHDRSELVVVADLSTTEETFRLQGNATRTIADTDRVEIESIAHIAGISRIGEAVAGVHTDVEPRPGEDRRQRLGRRRIGTGRKIGRKG